MSEIMMQIRIKIWKVFYQYQIKIASRSYFSSTWPTPVDFWATKGKWKEWVLLYKQNNNETLQPYVAFLRPEKYGHECLILKN